MSKPATYLDRVKAQRGPERGASTGLPTQERSRPPTRSYASARDKEFAESPDCVHKLKAKDSTGRWAYYFVHVPSYYEKAFLNALKSKETLDLETYGTVLASNYGEAPSRMTLEELKDRFGWTMDAHGTLEDGGEDGQG